ncbi:response regulator transcription factor [Paraburkholderia sp. J8-2]|uniref:response regulator transcription factor n=1 Tax=Paraburkholderia sp. J8-2 TaxID=2805440 RepID=UPI002AB5E6CA|nr:response regulator [Paraburkholderia sp. J8-2]
MSEVSPVVFVVDDDEQVRQAFARLLRTAGHLVETVGSAGELLAHPALMRHPTCILLDLALPDASGLDLQRALGAIASIVFVSAHGDMSTAIEAMRAGALDFLEKPVDEQLLLSAVARALERGIKVFAQHTRSSEIHLRMGRLTRREQEVMTLVADGLMNKQIANTLGIAERTIKIYRGRMMQKMHVRSVPELVRCLMQLDIDVPQAGDRR